MLQTTHKGLSGTALKTIALVLMLMDHIHCFFEFTGCIPEWFSMLARLSAPLFLFCTVEGFAHTHDRKRYFFRIWCIGAGMAAVQFFMIYAKAFRRGDGFYPQNAIFQDFVLLCVIWQGIDWVRAKKYGKGHCRYRGSGRLAVPVCCSAGNVPAAYAEADCQRRAGVCHHQPGAHVDQHHGRWLGLPG